MPPRTRRSRPRPRFPPGPASSQRHRRSTNCWPRRGRRTASSRRPGPGTTNSLPHLGEALPAGKQDEDGHFDVVPVTSRTARLFLGLQTQCVQCHDHPFNPEWKQQAFWGVNVFFRQVKRDGTPNMMRNNQAGVSVLTLGDDAAVNKEGLISYEKRSGAVYYTKPLFLDGRKVELD